MSDDDGDFMHDDDQVDEDYDFEYEEDDDEQGGEDASLENRYYSAKGMKEDDPDGAIREFKAIVEAEGGNKSDWGFKALKQQTKINFRRGRFEDALQTYIALLPYTKSAVTRNYSEKTINNILDYVSAGVGVDLMLMERFYEVTKKVLEESRNDRLSIKTDLKLARLWLTRQEWGRLSKTIRELREYCTTEDGTEDQSKGTILLEIFALEIQMYGATGNFKKLKEVYAATSNVKNAIPHPRILGIIKECGGKMHMSEKNWEAAQVAFFEAFRNYDEAGSAQRIQVLKYLVLAQMLMGSSIDPFDSQETKPYKEHPDIIPMTLLVGAYQSREVHEAEKIIRENHDAIMDDTFIRQYIEDVLRGLRTQYLVDLIQQYTRVELSFLTRQLNIPLREVEDLLVTLILDGKIDGRIDQVAARLELERPRDAASKRYDALSSWEAELRSLENVVSEKHGKGAGGGAASNAGAGMGMMGMGAGAFGFGGMGGMGLEAYD